jgi:hypothetical protein
VRGRRRGRKPVSGARIRYARVSNKNQTSAPFSRQKEKSRRPAIGYVRVANRCHPRPLFADGLASKGPSSTSHPASRPTLHPEPSHPHPHPHPHPRRSASSSTSASVVHVRVGRPRPRRSSTSASVGVPSGPVRPASALLRLRVGAGVGVGSVPCRRCDLASSPETRCGLIRFSRSRLRHRALRGKASCREQATR